MNNLSKMSNHIGHVFLLRKIAIQTHYLDFTLTVYYVKNIGIYVNVFIIGLYSSLTYNLISEKITFFIGDNINPHIFYVS